MSGLGASAMGRAKGGRVSRWTADTVALRTHCIRIARSASEWDHRDFRDDASIVHALAKPIRPLRPRTRAAFSCTAAGLPHATGDGHLLSGKECLVCLSARASASVRSHY